jgi:delta 1-pyrroline-5-carboxylate dehydrogenase
VYPNDQAGREYRRRNHTGAEELACSVNRLDLSGTKVVSVSWPAHRQHRQHSQQHGPEPSAHGFLPVIAPDALLVTWVTPATALSISVALNAAAARTPSWANSMPMSCEL